jgi:ATP-dependent DNA helicase RecG
MAKAVKKKPFDARPYMELAIKEMNESKNEPRPDGKVPPRVGAILLFPDGRVEKAHRGEFREGDHAEYTLIERLLPKEKLHECILFTTLEPCVERNSPKVPCCRRTTNARIKTVYVGIADPDPTVDGKGIKHLEKHGAQVHMFDRDLQKKIESANRKFIEQAIERKNSVEEEVIEMTPLELPVVAADFGEFSAEALLKFINAAKLKYRIEDPEFQTYLSTLGVLAFDKNTKRYKPTGVGILLFGHNPRLTFKQAALKAHVDYGGDKIEPVTFDQPLVLVPDLVENWLKKVIPLSKDTSSFKRTDVADFPIEVLREAIINGLVHRSFDNEGAKVSLEIDNDKIVIKSPGSPLPSISLEQLNTFKAPSISRNPIIAYVFNLMGYVEETGFGMRALKSLNEKYGLPLPEYTYRNPFLTLTFPRTIKAVKKVTSHKKLEELTEKEIEGYEWIKSKETVSAREYSAHFHIGYKTAQRHLTKMRGLKLIGDNGEPTNSPKYKYVAL